MCVRTVQHLNYGWPLCPSNRRKDTFLSRLHVGHSFSCWKRGEAPFCIPCNGFAPFETHCMTLSRFDFREKSCSVSSLRVLFINIFPDSIFDFLAGINVCNKSYLAGCVYEVNFHSLHRWIVEPLVVWGWFHEVVFNVSMFFSVIRGLMDIRSNDTLIPSCSKQRQVTYHSFVSYT